MASDFVRVCAVDDVVDGIPTAVMVGDDRRVVVRVGDALYALSGVCTHEAADLSEGIVENGVLWCPIHASGFDCRTGAVVHPPAEQALDTYPVVIEGGSVHVGRDRAG